VDRRCVLRGGQGGEAAETVDGSAHHRVVVARLGVAFVGGELEFCDGARGVPVFAEWEMGLLAVDDAIGIGSYSRGEVIGDVVVAGGARGGPVRVARS